jgi:hypothetical protein
MRASANHMTKYAIRQAVLSDPATSYIKRF